MMRPRVKEVNESVNSTCLDGLRNNLMFVRGHEKFIFCLVIECICV